jgi:UDP-N-acetylmuramoylalanine--D-glutamate ligase
MQLDGMKVMVYGAAVSGISATRMLYRLGADVILFDNNTNLTKEDIIDKLDESVKFRLITGSLTDELITWTELLIISPGVPCDSPDILRIKAKNIPIWGEIELACRYCRGKIIGITGTNGKTTTTILTGKILKAFYPEVYVVGNIGTSFSDAALDTTDNSIIVIELSSFQLETIHNFRPDVCAILNITPDHLDRHHTMEEYIAMKERITLNQTKEDICILNHEDATLRAMADRLKLKTKVMFFSGKDILDEGLFLEDDDIYYTGNSKKEHICNVNMLHVLGRHNHENIMAAVGIAVSVGVPMEVIKKTVQNFKGVEHRIEYVETINGVTYYNDSKGTNPDASIKAIQAMKSPTVLIAGGYDKRLSFDSWVEAFCGKIKLLILMGQTKKQIAKTAKLHGFTDIIFVDNLREAVEISAREAIPGDAVLLSPACASWGMFENFEQRGNLFKEYVRELIN